MAFSSSCFIFGLMSITPSCVPAGLPLVMELGGFFLDCFCARTGQVEFRAENQGSGDADGGESECDGGVFVRRLFLLSPRAANRCIRPISRWYPHLIVRI